MNHNGLFFVLVLIAGAFAQTCTNSAYRPISGECNNLDHPSWGKADIPLLRQAGPAVYADGLSLPRDGPNPRTVSQRLFATEVQKPAFDLTASERQTGLRPEPRGLNMMAIIVGQFVSHDIGETKIPFSGDMSKNFAIPMENCNANTSTLYDELCIYPLPGDPFARSGPQNTIFTRASVGVNDANGVFQPTNAVTAYLDLSTVYGSSEAVSNALRSHVDGLMIEGPNGTLPLASVTNTPNDCGSFRPGTSGVGDERGDENFLITSLHIMFLREHNRLARLYKAQGVVGDEAIFQAARRWNIAQWQHIVYEDWAPALLGIHAIPLKIYGGYDEDTDASIMTEFSTAAFRLHTMLNLPLLAVDEQCQLKYGVAKLAPNFPVKNEERQSCEAVYFRESMGPLPVVRGALMQSAQNYDTQITNDLRNLRLTAPGNGDVPAANVFRGRAHGLQGFNTVRQAFGQPNLYDTPVGNGNANANQNRCIFDADAEYDSMNCFSKLTPNASLAVELRDIFKKVDNIDPFVGFLAERKAFGSSIGRSATAAAVEQLRRVRDGDRYWYENGNQPTPFTLSERMQIATTTLGDLISRNFPEISVTENAFFVPSEVAPQCEYIFA